MDREYLATCWTMIAFGVVGVVAGVFGLILDDEAVKGVGAFGALVGVGGLVQLRKGRLNARMAGQSGPRRRPDSVGGVYPGPTGDAGSGWHVDRQRDGNHDSNDAVGGSTGGDSGGRWSGGDSGGGWSGGGDSGGGGGGS
ncbi:hypothetical protein ACGFIW_27415 [Micromonospora sp. NPDC048935]|uniref:hypothetical protein n=1 Tax=Micromonospora sp. NPDC048935 TaxID=3364262 RepID=UPI003716CD0B